MSISQLDGFANAAVVLADLRAGNVDAARRMCWRCPRDGLWIFADGECRMVVRIGETHCLLAIEVLDAPPPNHIDFIARATALASTGTERLMR
ncbi:MAG: hypothetical protein ACWA6X_12585 [Bauldia sp.]